jgi:HEAT repeat protein
MIVFCTHCWAETQSTELQCSQCGADLTTDARSYEEKLIAALDCPLAQVRIRVCWLINTKEVQAALWKLIALAREDADLFVRRAAVEALGHLHSPLALPVLETLAAQNDRWLAVEARRSIHHLTQAVEK